jgi:Ca2+ transporting ATPase
LANEDYKWLLSTLICQNTYANPIIASNLDGSISNEQIGNKTDCALLELAFKLGYDYRKCRNT